jgi:hypothetical protein
LTVVAVQRSAAPAPPDAPEPPPSRLFLTASYVVLFIGGLVAALVGAFLLPYSVSPGVDASSTGGGVGTTAGAAGQHVATHVVAVGGHGGVGQVLSVGLLVALLVNPTLSFAGLRTAGTRLAAATPMLGWLVVVLPALSSTSDGDTILPNDLRSIAFVLLGGIGFAGVTLLGRPSRGMTSVVSLTGAPRPPSVTRGAAPKSAPSRAAPKRGKRR